MLIASPAGAAEPTGWRTADGRLYFGSAPPPGSVETRDIRLRAPAAPAPRAAAPFPRAPEERTARPQAAPVVVPKPRPRPAPADGVAFVAPPATVGEGENRALTTCVRNHGREARRVWMAGPERIPVGVIEPGGVRCVAVPAPEIEVGQVDFHLETEPPDTASRDDLARRVHARADSAP